VESRENYKDLIKTSQTRLSHLNGRVSGLKHYIKRETNKAVRAALEEELRLVNQQIDSEKKSIRKNERELRYLEENNGR
jgi:hypothetical protein